MVGSSGRSDLSDKGGIDSTNEKIVRKKSDVGIIRRNIGVGKTRKSISRPHHGARNVSKVKIEVL